MDVFRKLGEIEALPDLTTAEREVLRCAPLGEVADFRERDAKGAPIGTPPTTAHDGNRVRAGIIRYLLLGGCEACRCHEKGVRIVGAMIPDELDLEGCEAPRDLVLGWCRLEGRLIMRGARLATVNLHGSRIAAPPDQDGAVLLADGLRTDGGVFLRGGFHATGAVRLLGAVIGGNLECNGARIKATAKSAEGAALLADGLRTEGGVFLRGGFHATGAVRLPGAVIGGDLACVGARIVATAESAEGAALIADGLRTDGGAFLRGGFHATGAVRLLGAVIGGNLECNGARIEATAESAVGAALNADGLRTDGDVFLHGGFHATGAVRLLGAVIGGNLSCIGARIEAREGETPGFLLSLYGAKVSNHFFWYQGARIGGRMDLRGAHVGLLCDERSCWPEDAGNLALDGFTYGRIAGGPVDAAARLEWIGLSETADGAFYPQPYEQLAKVLREMGHLDDARTVLVAKERKQRADFRTRARRRVAGALRTIAASYDLAQDRREPLEQAPSDDAYRRQDSIESGWIIREFLRGRARPGGDSDSRKAREGTDPASRALAARGRRNEMRGEIAYARWRVFWSHVWQRALDWVIGFGHRPFRAFGWLFTLWLIAAVLFSGAWSQGAMTPNAAPVLVSAQWRAALDDETESEPASHIWAQRAPGDDYETFNRYAYAFDVVVPLIDLGQESAWAPSTSRGPFGVVAWWMRWVLKILGWFVSALGAAAITGVIRRD